MSTKNQYSSMRVVKSLSAIMVILSVLSLLFIFAILSIVSNPLESASMIPKMIMVVISLSLLQVVCAAILFVNGRSLEC